MKTVIVSFIAITVLLGCLEFFGIFKKVEKITAFVFGLAFLIVSLSAVKNRTLSLDYSKTDSNISVSTSAAENIAVRLIDTVLKENGVSADEIKVKAYFEDGNIKIKNVSVKTSGDTDKIKRILENQITAENIEVKYDKGRT